VIAPVSVARLFVGGLETHPFREWWRPRRAGWSRGWVSLRG